MHLQTPTNSLTLAIVGYQFPDLQLQHNNPYDPNWLLIRVTVATSEGAYTVLDPSLLTSEVAELADWLGSLSVFSGAKSIGFTEPNISFNLAHLPYNQPTLEVHLAAECKAPWHRDTLHDTVLSFPLPTLDLTAITHSIRLELAQFPFRSAPNPP